MRPPPWLQRVGRTLKRAWHTENAKAAAVRDIFVAGFVVLLLLSVLWVYTGQSFPSQAPLVVVESGSMMHGPHGYCLQGRCNDAFPDPAFGRLGTIDPGDLVLVKAVDSLDDVESAFESGTRRGYGGHGDVIVYKRPTGGDAGTPIIHRAMLHIRVDREGCVPNQLVSPCVYKIPETCDPRFEAFVKVTDDTSDWRRYCQGSSSPITIQLERDGLWIKLDEYPCARVECGEFYSGILTKGDNNPSMDQPSAYGGSSGIVCCPVRPEWIVGKARAEIPWFGLIKLSLYGNEKYQCGAGEMCSDPTQGAQWTILRATAPWDIWVGLFAAVGILIATPVAVDLGLNRWRRRRQKPQVVPPAPEKPAPTAPESKAPPAKPAQKKRVPASPRAPAPRPPARRPPRTP